jgi:hypothetical protein
MNEGVRKRIKLNTFNWLCQNKPGKKKYFIRIEIVEFLAKNYKKIESWFMRKYKNVTKNVNPVTLITEYHFYERSI